jgi:hypothetical protein
MPRRLNQHDERRAVDEVAVRGVHAEARLGGASVRRHDDTRAQEVIRDRHSGVEDAARIVSQIEHQTPDSARIVAF